MNHRQTNGPGAQSGGTGSSHSLEAGAWRAALDSFVVELQAVYGARLEHVVLYGSQARGEAAAGSDIDTLVVLGPGGDFWREFHRIGPIASRVSLEHDVVISAIPVDHDEYRTGEAPLLVNARREGTMVV
jgi:predicted nucleotidyltransferase